MDNSELFLQPELFTSRLNLRALELRDSNNIFRLRTDKKVNKYIDRPASHENESGADFINKITTSVKQGSVFYWAITLKEAPKLIGTICLWNFNKDKTIAEIGYDLFSEFQNKGLMTEAINAVLDFGFKTIECKGIEAFTHRDNQASIAVLLKHGFMLDNGKFDEHNNNNIIFVKTND